jgi:hypothetical protein
MDWHIGAAIGGMAGGIVAVLLSRGAPQRKCPDCGQQLPRLRKPTSLRQLLWGGYTCGGCSCAVYRNGLEIESRPPGVAK